MAEWKYHQACNIAIALLAGYELSSRLVDWA